MAAGLILLPYAALVLHWARRDRLEPAAVWTLIACNLLWAAECSVVAFSGWVAPSTFGYLFLLAQVVVVVVFAELQYIGLKRSTAVEPVSAR